MENTVASILEVLGLPINFLKRPQFGKSKTVISYHFFNQGNAKYGDGKPNEQNGVLQVDVFSKTDYTSTVSEVKALLAGANFMYFDGDDNIDQLSPNEQLYHKVLIFNYVESEVTQ